MSSNQPQRPSVPPTTNRNIRSREGPPPAPLPPPAAMPRPANPPYYPPFPFELDTARMYIPAPAAHSAQRGPDPAHTYRNDQQFPDNRYAPRHAPSQRPRKDVNTNWQWGTPQTPQPRR